MDREDVAKERVRAAVIIGSKRHAVAKKVPIQFAKKRVCVAKKVPVQFAKSSVVKKASER